MFNPLPCLKCGQIITDDDVLDQDISFDDAFAFATLTLTCPHCGHKMGLECDMSWRFKELEEKEK